ncbi:MAG: exodeoxyribonuclease VII large subunit [Spirochaetales bacterium]|nr:exodeoxyribonuclease VII large subunit [Spirochaetales bacterium]
MNAVRPLSVSELTLLVKTTLEDGFPAVLVEGEISNWRPASSGHVYFTLKDRESQLDAVMFRGRAGRLAFAPRDGLLVRAGGALSVYAARGRYQLIVESMERAGEGDLLAALEERKKRLSSEGLFDDDRKRPIPRLPRRVGVVTSPTGAAIRDILSTLARRDAACDVIILPAAVQGTEAPGEIAARIRYANAHGLAEVLIVGRGGGSLEDLLAFSDEEVVRAVAGSAVPVISAVGHEIDWALSDYAADFRAATPTAAAEFVSMGRHELLEAIADATGRLEDTLRGRLERARLAIDRFRPESLELQFRRIMQPLLLRLDDGKECLVEALGASVREARHRIELARGALEASDPDAVLGRGFAVVTRADNPGTALRGSAGLERGSRLSIRFARGSASATVEEIRS